ncbi:MAG: pitrilysin family protein [Armatimonadota bacterium]|nr:insulinase family protein [bacterium]
MILRRVALLSLGLIVLFGSCAFAQDSAQKNAVVKKVLDNGLTLIVKPEPGSGIVAIVAMVKAGCAQESIQNAGLGNFVAQLVLASTRMSSAEEVAAVADEVGGNVGSQWQPDFTEIRAVTTSAMFNRAMSLIGECLTEATFEGKWVEEVRSELLRRVNAQSDDLFGTAYSDIRGLLYQDSGYKRPNMGFERTVRLATPGDLQKFYSTYYVPNNIVISVAGDITLDQALDRAEKAFAGIPPGKLPVDRGMPDEKLERSSYHASEVDLGAAYLMLGWLAPGVGMQDYPAVSVLGNALGGGKGSVMFQELRQKRGMGYDLGVMYPKLKYQSHLLAYIITDPFKFSLTTMSPELILEDVKTALLEQVDTLKNAPLDQKALDRAKGYTIGSYNLSHQHLLDRAFDLCWFETIGAGYDMYTRYPEEVEKVTAGDVQRAANKYLGDYAAELLLPKSGTGSSGENP